MRALAKQPQPPEHYGAYRAGGHNDALLTALLEEQGGYCAYSEKLVTGLDTCAVEHFDARRKGTPDDGYHNHYGTLQHMNQRKRRKEQRHSGARFFETRFFQEPGAVQARVAYVPGEFVFEEREEGDDEAKDLLDFICVNDPEVVHLRRQHVRRLKEIFEAACYGEADMRAYFARHPDELSFLTALEAELGITLR